MPLQVPPPVSRPDPGADTWSFASGGNRPSDRRPATVHVCTVPSSTTHSLRFLHHAQPLCKVHEVHDLKGAQFSLSRSIGSGTGPALFGLLSFATSDDGVAGDLAVGLTGVPSAFFLKDRYDAASDAGARPPPRHNAVVAIAAENLISLCVVGDLTSWSEKKKSSGENSAG